MQLLQQHIDYPKIMETIEGYLQKATLNGGFHTLTESEAKELQRLSLLAEQYEDSIPLMPITQPQTLKQVLELKMYQMQLKQKDLAKILEISESKLSELLNGKRQMNLGIAKKIHQKLNVSGDFILKIA